MPINHTRRHWLNRALALSSAGLLGSLTGCGFELRKVPQFGFKTVAIRGFTARSLMLEELRLNLSAAATVVEASSAAQVVFESLQDSRERVVTASTAAGQVRTFQLRTRLKFQVRTPQGVTLLPASEIFLFRDMSYNESQALAKEQEEAQLFRIMQSDIVSQVMRRLATITLPAA